MSKYLLSMVLGLAMLTGLASAAGPAASAQSVAAETAAAAVATPWQLSGTYSNLGAAQARAAELQSFGLETAITQGNGYYYVWSR